MARPNKRIKPTPQIIRIFEDDLSRGYTIEGILGRPDIVNVVRRTTIYEWLNEKSNKFHFEFSEAVRRGYCRYMRFIETLKISKLINKEIAEGIKPSDIDMGVIYFEMKSRFQQYYFPQKEAVVVEQSQWGSKLVIDLETMRPKEKKDA